MPNRLQHEKSPYLLQHAENPVDWHPWSEAAFEAARDQDKPVFLSIGYATCHWCHVMERESFEDPEAARHLNDTFVCIKVDREERPDIDAVYMAVCQMVTGRGGWPLTIFMTPDRRPFFGGTYIPKESRHGSPGLIDICRQVKGLWENDRSKVLDSAESITAHLGRAFTFDAQGTLPPDILDQARRQLGESFDAENGGFDAAPKFPTPHRLRLLLRHHRRTGDAKSLEMVTRTLMQMALGGLWDHVGYGFHRYSTDNRWLLPHFEKMLYDQALLARAYLEGAQVTARPDFAETARSIFAYVLRDMTDPDGGFYAAEDADSEGEEGKFYVWTEAELREVLGEEEAAFWGRVFGVRPEGNFLDEATGRRTGANILHLDRPLADWSEGAGMSPEAFRRRWEAARATLFQHREKRVRPLRDDKILTDWNGLMIGALALGGRSLDEPAYTEAAQKAADFVLKRMTTADGGLFHRYRDGEAGIAGHADDYAFLVDGLLELYRTTFDPRWLEKAIELQERMIADFWDSEGGGFFLSGAEATGELPVRPRELFDGATPSANSVALTNLLTLARLTGEASWETRADALIRAFAGVLERQPSAFAHFLMGADWVLHPTREIVLDGPADAPETREMIDVVHRAFLPEAAVLLRTPETAEALARLAPFVAGLPGTENGAAAYLCSGFACEQPVTDPAILARRIAQAP